MSKSDFRGHPYVGNMFPEQFNPERVLSRLMARYFLRMEEAVAEACPSLSFEATLRQAGVTRSTEGAQSAMDNFALAVKTLLQTGKIDGLGLRFGSRLRLSDYGLMGLATASCPTFGDALKLELAHDRLVLPIHEVGFKSTFEKDKLLITIREYYSDRWTEHYLIEQEVASILALVRELLPDVNMRKNCQVNLAYARPRYWQLYKELLPCRLRFRQTLNQVLIPIGWLQMPLQNSDPELSRILGQQCQHIIRRLEQQGSWVDRVRHLLLEDRGKQLGLEEAAQRLGVPVHTFRRRLYRAGTNYKKIAYTVRMELAADYLRETSLSLQEIASLLGYENTPNFFNAFRKYWKTSPARFRYSEDSSR